MTSLEEPIPVSRPFLWGNELKNINAALNSGWISSHGPMVEAFEHEFGRYVGRRHAVAVCNGTAAVHLALTALGIGPGDEVIVPDFCMIAPIFAVIYCGAVPVSVDIDETWNLDPEAVAAAITPRTRAILVVHNYGHPAEVHTIAEIANQHDIPLIEDAAEALGATVAGRPVGSFGKIACYSFYANKLITTGEGGMLVCDDAELNKRARWKRSMCFGADNESRFLHGDIGFNYRLSSLQAAIGLAQLEHIEEALQRKIEIASHYHARLAGTPGLTLPSTAPWATHAYWVYGILVESAFGATRQELQHRLAEKGIETRRFFSPVHEQPIFGRQSASRECPRSRAISETGFYVPSFVGMTESEIDRVSDTIRLIQTHGNH